MWRKIQSLIAFLCIFVYIGAAVFAVMQIRQGIKDQMQRSVKEFAELKDFAGRASVLGFLNNQFKDDIKNYLTMSKTIQGVIIYGPGGGNLALEKLPGTISYETEYPRFKPQLRLNKEPFSDRLNIENVPSASISAVASVIDYNQLLYILRTSLLAILIASVISFSTLILDIALVNGNNQNLDNNNNNDDETIDNINKKQDSNVVDIDKNYLNSYKNKNQKSRYADDDTQSEGDSYDSEFDDDDSGYDDYEENYDDEENEDDENTDYDVSYNASDSDYDDGSENESLNFDDDFAAAASKPVACVSIKVSSNALLKLDISFVSSSRLWGVPVIISSKGVSSSSSS
ncbi:hypothetical protein FACS1894102_6200 [Spirochaetia bacterium]|nr:hypothetical protein FACS1894102_6200 [Spirochaetia bacterium]